MARGITQDRVNQAADALLQRGQRPTIDKVRAELGTGSPNTLIRLLEIWWAGLAERLAAQARADLPGVPEPVQGAMMTLWSAAILAAREEASTRLTAAKDAVEQEKQSLAAERLRWGADLDTARNDAMAANDACVVAEQRLADHQHLANQLRGELHDVIAQRDKAQERSDRMEREMIQLSTRLEKQSHVIAEERQSMTTYARLIEDRAHAEVDRAREEAKSARVRLQQLERDATAAGRDADKRIRAAETTANSLAKENSALGAKVHLMADQIQRLNALLKGRSAKPLARPTANRPAKRKAAM
ncbi:MAG: hypothetical protein E6K53_12940 [Gammaproteobacteria bacterium]|nr:MAG: hypothetical protein E6K53_12940 [Gammaproteobacteria bacterium]